MREMATRRSGLSGWLMVALVVALLVAASGIQAAAAAAAAAPGFCAGKCAARCGRARARGACVQSCVLCCGECSCVPAAARGGGGAGRVDDCPCYRDMLTAGPRKRPKCP